MVNLNVQFVAKYADVQPMQKNMEKFTSRDFLIHVLSVTNILVQLQVYDIVVNWLKHAGSELCQAQNKFGLLWF